MKELSMKTRFKFTKATNDRRMRAAELSAGLGSTMHMRDVYQTMEAITEVPAPTRNMPTWLLLGYAALSKV